MQHSAKLYDITLTFDPSDYDGKVNKAALLGEFLFYRSKLTGHTDQTGMRQVERKYPPSMFEAGMSSIGGNYYEEMALDPDDGLYKVNLRLPAGGYTYRFLINPCLDDSEENLHKGPGPDSSFVITKDGSRHNLIGKEASCTDPGNDPDVPTISGQRETSTLLVGSYEEDLRNPLPDPARRGSITYMSYQSIDGSMQSLCVYLPAGYTRSKIYPVVYVSHGGGGSESSWLHCGNIDHIMDNLIASGKTPESVLVMMNNSVYEVKDGMYHWDFETLGRNMTRCIIPYVQTMLSVYTDRDHIAFCGLSMGSMTTLYMYYQYPELFGTYGCFSGGLAGGPFFKLNDPYQKESRLLIGCAEDDIAYNEWEIGVPPTIRKLKEAGLPCETYFTTASHDWFCWPEMFAYFMEHTWKPER